MARRLGLLVDWGGVMTTNLFDSFSAFCELEGLEPGALVQRVREDKQCRDLVLALETGALEEPEFERRFAPRLGVDAEGFIDRVFAGSAPDDAMQAAVLAARRAGVRTGLLSNSWGTRRYPRARLTELFDAVTISGEVALRKPAPEIYGLAVRRLGVPADATVFVDDLPHNLEPAAALGMATVHHVDPETTIAELEKLLEAPLR
jgi:putative hydrolase of the HAD superfamily